MTVLIADVGGTNARLALMSGSAPTHVTRFENDAYASFYEVLTDYRAKADLADVTGCCIAVAGPVTADRARLTNRDWEFDLPTLRREFPAAQKVKLTNDLVALGHALPYLRPDQLAQLRPLKGGAANDQALVAGMGTGFNACLLKAGQVIEAELGHASLPSSVASILRDELGTGADPFATNEDLFSGRGLSRLYRVIAGRDRAGPAILSAYDEGTDDAARRAVQLSARLMGTFSREMVLQYLPLAGIHFAGGAARGILSSAAVADYLAAFAQGGPLSEQVARVPVRLITDDTAALIGVARYFDASMRG